MFSFNWLKFGEGLGGGGGGGVFEIGYPRSGGSKNFGCSWTRGMEGLENWTIFMEVICVSPLICLLPNRWTFFFSIPDNLLWIYFLMMSFTYIFLCPFSLLHLLPPIIFPFCWGKQRPQQLFIFQQEKSVWYKEIIGVCK